jgi:predicted CXXCH cytochrome family protein
MTFVQTIRALAAAAFAVVVLAGCGVTKRQWLTFFFDGVPSGTNTVQTARVGADENISTNVAVTSGPALASVKVLLHQPYGDHSCNECHESKFSQKLKSKPLELCFSCHDDFLEKAKVKHPPAADGECLACHSPHQSTEPGLLLQKVELVCAECHEDADLAKVKVHIGTKESCVKCHNPHASDEKFLLKAGATKVAEAK